MNSSNKTLAALAAHAESSVGNQRRLQRAKAVLPVRISGNDLSGNAYSELVHTLDVSRAEFGWVRFVANSKWEAWSCFSIGNTSQSFA